MPTSKVCSKCKEVKSVSDFCKNKRGKHGLSSTCKACIKRWRATTRGRADAIRCDSRYKGKKRGHEPINMTLDELVSFLDAHDNTCDICGVHVDGCATALFVDHDHDTGAVRGMLCHKCNTSASYEHVIRNLDKYKAYAEKHHAHNDAKVQNPRRLRGRPKGP